MSISYARNVKVISDGTFLIEGGTMFGKKSRNEWELHKRPDRQNRIKAALNCLLVMGTEGNLMLNAGMGNRYPAEMKEIFGKSSSKLNANLRNIAHLSPRDITHVFFTSMHYQNSGGALRINKNGDLTLNFPNAVHITHRKSWEEVIQPSMLQKEDLYGPYPEQFKQDIEIIKKKGNLMLIEDYEYEILPGVTMKEVGGFGHGHTVVKILQGSEQYLYLANLVPTSVHLEMPVINSYDRNPEESIIQKTLLLKEAKDKGYRVVMSNENEYPMGYLMRNGAFRPVEF